MPSVHSSTGTRVEFSFAGTSSGMAHHSQPRSQMGQAQGEHSRSRRNYCSTFHAWRTGQLTVLSVRASQARAAYVAAPGSHDALDALRHAAAASQAATDTLRAGILLHEYRDQSTYCFNQLHRQRQQGAVISHLQQQQGSPVADLCTIHGRQQADSIIVNFVSADSPTGMFRRLPADLSAQQSLLSSLDRQLPSETQRACEGAEQGITLD